MGNFGPYHIRESVLVSAIPYLGKEWEKRGVCSGCTVFYHRGSRLVVIISKDTMENGRTYLHVSLSHPNRMPDWNTCKMAKELFIGKDRDAFIYFPPEREYVNFMPFCLHLWSEVKDVA